MMKTNKALKCAAMVAVLGTCFSNFGCNIFGGGFGRFFGQFLSAVPAAVATEFLLDNDGVFDLFEDGATATNP
ncbi:MAG: hypothetical protein GXP29_04455 [Planctomycetes bacterium]|nr:hypothetical protein [Planctomycetota bacterium]